MLRFISLGMEQPVREDEYSPPPDSEGKNRGYVANPHALPEVVN
jgi:hypothetical protein